MMRRAVAVALAASVLLVSGMIGRSQGLEQERASAVAELTALTEQYHDAGQRTDYLDGAVDRAEQDTAERAAVLAQRPAFLAEVQALTVALKGAEGRVDTAAHRAAALSAQQTVAAEKENPDTVAAATATVHALTEKVGTEVASWQA
ncbi:hypothetical protein DSP71_11970, partial [Microbacterium sp. H6]